MHVWLAGGLKEGWMCVLHSNMCSWATCSSSIYSSSSVSSHLFICPLYVCLSVLLCVYVCLFVPVCDWWLRVKHLTLSRKPMMKTRVKSTEFIKVRPEMTNTQTTGLMPHMLTVLPSCCVETLRDDTWQDWKCCVLHWICSLSATRCSH